LSIFKIKSYISFRSLRALTRLMVSANSIYPDDRPLESLVILTLCLSFLWAISSHRNILVASPSRFGFVAMISSSFPSLSSIRLKREAKLRSHTKTPFIGDIAPHKTWYTPVNQPDCSRVSKSRYSSTIHICVWSRREFAQIEHDCFPASVTEWQISHFHVFSLMVRIFSLSSLR